MKILFLTTVTLSVNGITEFISQYVENEKMNQVDIVSSIPSDSQIKSDLMKYCSNFYRYEYRKDNPIKYMMKLISLMRKNKYDIVHAHGTSATLAIELLAAKIAGVKIRIAHSHNTFCENIKLDKLMRPLFNRSYTHALACGEKAGEWLFGNEKFKVIPNARDVNRFKFNLESRIEIREKLNLDEKILVGHVGVFYAQKNYPFIIDLFEDLCKKSDEYRLVLMGRGPQFQEIKDYADKKGLADKIVFTGLVSDVEKYLSAMDVMILPSLFEGLPLVAIEWQINGLPSLLSNTITEECKITDLLEFLPIDNVEVWSNKLLGFKERKEQTYEKFAEQVVQQGYDASQMNTKINSYYKEIV